LVVIGYFIDAQYSIYLRKSGLVGMTYSQGAPVKALRIVLRVNVKFYKLIIAC
jgi:hypothetical protein